MIVRDRPKVGMTKTVTEIDQEIINLTVSEKEAHTFDSRTAKYEEQH